MPYNYRAYMLKEINGGLPLSKVSLDQHWKSIQKSNVHSDKTLFLNGVQIWS